jgi:hypothetical protein
MFVRIGYGRAETLVVAVLGKALRYLRLLAVLCHQQRSLYLFALPTKPGRS